MDETLMLKDNEQQDLAIKALAKIEESENLPRPNPSTELTNSATDFLEKFYALTLNSNRLAEKVEESLIEDLPGMKVDEKITVLNIERSAMNDRIFKMASAASSLVSAQGQLAAAKNPKDVPQNNVQINVGTTSADTKVAEKTSPEIINGLDTLNALMQAIQIARKNDSEEEE